MKKLCKKQVVEMGRLVAGIDDARGGLEQQIDAFNAALEEQWALVEEKLSALNEAIEEAETFRADIASDQDAYFSERSEKWQEGEVGSAYSDWMQSWENELSEVELEKPDELEMPDTDALGEFEELPEEP